MYIIAGLGNPTREYKNTRHNIGFDAIDYIARKIGVDVEIKKHKALIGKGNLEGEKLILAKPQTYINLSGESIREMIHYYKIVPKEQLIILYDDISLKPGQLRIRAKGSSGGHNGIKSIINNICTDEFIRIKIGIGEKPIGYDLADYVLGYFSKEERENMDQCVKRVYEGVKCILTNNIQKAMNDFNQSIKH